MCVPTRRQNTFPQQNLTETPQKWSGVEKQNKKKMAESEDDKIDKKVAELVTDGLVDTDEDKLEMLEKLGEGSYGSVWRARNRETGVEYAIKKLSVFDNDLDELRLEIAFMKTCDSPYVVKYFGSLICGSELWIAME